MKLITRDTDYGVRALRYMALNEKNLTSVKNLVKELDMPRAFIRKILQILSDEEILQSFKGKGGGFQLAKSPEEIYLIEIMEIFQGPLKINQCIFKGKVCPNIEKCKLKEKIDSIQNYVISELKGITLATLLQEE